jgi:cytochrome c-type biogenesis protein CcmH/NrfG
MRRWFSHRPRAASRLALVVLALVVGLARTTRAQIAEERLPGADLPSAALRGVSATPNAVATTVGGDASADWQRLPANGESPLASEPAPIADAPSPPAAVASEPPAALDLSTTSVGPDLGAASLALEFRRAPTPARVASLRLTEQARQELLKGDANAALQDLGRAVSIDPGNPFEYYYLGRVYLTRHNLPQAATFFQRAELGFAGRPDWLGETLSFEGACDEQLGRSPDAVKAYKRAVALAPGNFRAQAGLGRVAPSTATVTGLDEPAPPDQADAPPPAAPIPPPAPDESPAPPPADIPN